MRIPKLVSALSLLVTSFAISSLALADADVVHRSQPSTYITSGPSHYLNNTIRLDRWAEGLTMTAQLVKGDKVYDVEAFLQPESSNKFSGSGKIYVRYGGGYGCIHRFGVIVYAYEDRVYLRENTPRYIPYNPQGPCTAAGPYEWFNHPEPYYFAD